MRLPETATGATVQEYRRTNQGRAILTRTLDRYRSEQTGVEHERDEIAAALATLVAGPPADQQHAPAQTVREQLLLAEVERLQNMAEERGQMLLATGDDVRELKEANSRLTQFAEWALNHKNSYTRLLAHRALTGEWGPLA
ncbi:MAG: hypothetical protein J2O48_11770 [Solirubrobacterales bacterium]|nr:hypothetical protein [Solirubrobacterales bacterium]